jgi:hypothetical protein
MDRAAVQHVLTVHKSFTSTTVSTRLPIGPYSTADTSNSTVLLPVGRAAGISNLERLDWLFLARGNSASESESACIKLTKEEEPSEWCGPSELLLILVRLVSAFGFAPTIAMERFLRCPEQGGGDLEVSKEPSCRASSGCCGFW